MKKVPVAYQLYSAKHEMKRDMLQTLRQVKDLGFEGVEFAGFFGHSAKDMKQILAKIGLLPVSSHVALNLIQGDPQQIIQYHLDLGCLYIAVPWLAEEDRPGSVGFAKSLQALYTFGAQCRQAGIQLLYHNHDFEFQKVSGIYGLDFIYQAIPAYLLQSEIDTCWVKYAGVNPVTYLVSYKGRAPLVHIKDFVAENNDRTPYALINQAEPVPADYTGFSYRPFGHGSQDAPALVQAAIDADAQWLILEQDDPYGESPLVDAKLSMETFRRLGVL